MTGSVLLVWALVSAVDAGPAEPRPLEPPEARDAGVADVHMADAGTHASELVVTARIEPDPVPFGGRFELVIEVVRPSGAPLTLPGTLPENDACARAGDARRTVADVVGSARTVASGSDAGPAASVSLVKETIRVPYLALDTQDVKTPALVLTAKDGATLDVPALPVRIDVPPDTGPDGGVLLGPDGGPIAPGQVMLEAEASALAYRVPDQRPWVVVAALASSLVALVIVRFVQRRLKLRAPKPVAAPLPPPRPAHEIALERLDALLASGMLTRGETEAFVSRLMDEVLRDYIAARFRLSADTQTTRELVKELLGVTVTGLDVALVDELLKDADLVKFAKAAIASDRAHAMAVRVRTLVEATAVRATTDAGRT